jgi:hypothetical protein
MAMLDQSNTTGMSTPNGDAVLAATADTDETFYATGPTSLEAATRLVDPMRLNNLTPEEIVPRHLRRANREVRKARRALVGIQHAAQRVLGTARTEAQRGQRLARTSPSRRRAHQVQIALRRAAGLSAYYAALEDERSRYARKVAAARDLLHTWEHEKRGLTRRPGGFAARNLRQTTLNLGRIERVTRERLDEARRALVHVSVAEEAMRRDADMVRLDPVNFKRFAGRGRLGVRLAGIAIILALIAFVYPPWSPPHLLLACTIPTKTNNACTAVHAASGLQIENHGSGMLVGWATINVSQDGNDSMQTIPIILLPHGARQLSCGDYSGCATQSGSSIHVQITTSGGSSAVAVVP